MTLSPACNYPHLSTPNQRLAGFAQIVSLCAELFEGPPRQATLSGSNIERSRNYNGPCGWSEMWVIARFGWPLHVGAAFNPRSLANFPMQANGAEMLRLACCLATERGIRVCAPVHDALLIEAPL